MVWFGGFGQTERMTKGNRQTEAQRDTDRETLQRNGSSGGGGGGTKTNRDW